MSTKENKIASFDPSQPSASDAGLFGLPFTAIESDIIIVPVPWEVTVSYGSGASTGPETIRNASYQVDLLHQDFPELWKLGMYMDEIPASWVQDGEQCKILAQSIIEALEEGKAITEDAILSDNLSKINAKSEALNAALKAKVLTWMEQGKKVILLGGDHSTPLGYYQALASKYNEFGILHLDAHMDLRIAYEGFTYSHASIMYNAIQMPQVTKLVQVGIRDFSQEEVTVIQQTNKVKVFTDTDLKYAQFEGKTWQEQVDGILENLPNNVCVSLDIDALYQWYCPNTGTPVPGGLSYEQVTYLLNRLAVSDKNIIGIDMVEVAQGEDEWDGNVGARMLFHLCGVLAKNNGLNVGERIVF